MMNTIEITILGRGGQGAQVGAQMLAAAFFRAGWEVQAFASYGGERRGAPVTAAVRVSDSAIHLRCDVAHPQYALVLDPSLAATVAAPHHDSLTGGSRGVEGRHGAAWEARASGSIGGPSSPTFARMRAASRRRQ